MPSHTTFEAPAPGDLVVIAAHRVGELEQLGEILEVLPASQPHYRVRWEDGHESIFFPGADATIRPASRRRRGS
jgi:hypothetical protein